VHEEKENSLIKKPWELQGGLDFGLQHKWEEHVLNKHM
jgi:hypothetical protein